MNLLRPPLICLALLISLGPARADEQTFWAHGIRVQADLPYGEHELQRMDGYMHGERTGESSWFVLDETPRPTLVWIHGGGWLMGDKNSQLPQLIPYLQRGWNVFNINYRQGPGTAPQAVDDVMCAYRKILDALKAGAQPTDRVVVSGASAGGHLALMVGLLNSSGDHPCRVRQPPRAVINWYGITDIAAVDTYLQQHRPDGNYARRWVGDPKTIAEISRRFSPLGLIDNAAAGPSILTIHGTNDTIVPYTQAQALHQALQKTSTTSQQLLTLHGANHGGASDEQYQLAYRTIFRFLADVEHPEQSQEPALNQ